MTYWHDKMELEVIASLLHGTVNDVLICRDLRSPAAITYTLWVVHDRETLRKLLSLWGAATAEEQPYLFSFSENDDVMFGFPYQADRSLFGFAAAQNTSAAVAEKICLSLLMTCLSSGMPFPILYLMLQQEKLQLTAENNVYLSYALDLSALELCTNEGNCAGLAARLAIRLLGDSSKKLPNSCKLLQKKSAKGSYRSFSELYRDIRLTAIPEGKSSLLARLRGMVQRNRDRLFRWLLAFCTVVVIITLLMMVSQALFGDIPFLRLFQHRFDWIGTELLH